MDLRSAPRFPVHFPVLLGSNEIVGKGTIRNLSVWGCAVSSTAGVHRGDRLGLLLIVPDPHTPVAIDLAKVRWATPKEFGLEFLTMPHKSRTHLREFLLSLRRASACVF